MHVYTSAEGHTLKSLRGEVYVGILTSFMNLWGWSNLLPSHRSQHPQPSADGSTQHVNVLFLGGGVTCKESLVGDSVSVLLIRPTQVWEK